MDNIKVIFQKRRDKALKDLEDRKAEINTFIPKIKQIDQQINKMGIQITKAVLMDPEKIEFELKAIEEEIKMLKRERAILLTEHNIPHDYLDVHYQCETCEDTGFLKNGQQCHCYKQEVIKQSYKFSNITDILERENFSTFNLELFSDDYNEDLKMSVRNHMTEVLNTCRDFVDNFEKPVHTKKKNLLFFGETGLGKTFLCNCIAKALLDKGHTVLYQTSFRIIDTISNYRFSNPKTDQMKFNYNLLITTDLLIIDDLGTEMINSFSNTELFNIINSRLLQNKRTIISTNFNPSQLSENYTERISSRLFGYYEFIPFVGNDLRWEI